MGCINFVPLWSSHARTKIKNKHSKMGLTATLYTFLLNVKLFLDVNHVFLV